MLKGWAVIGLINVLVLWDVAANARREKVRKPDIVPMMLS